MKIENKLPTKNYNVSQESDSSIFFRYVWFFLCIIFGIYIFFIALSHIVVLFISIEDEKSLFSPIADFIDLRDLPEDLWERYKDLDYSVSVTDMEETENAFADLWWRVYITQNLLDSIEYREELDFLIGHEFAHIENRDVLKSLVSDVPLSVILTLFGWEKATEIFNALLKNTHSKMWESRADRYALDFTYNLNGHVWCALNFLMKKNTLWDNVLEVFSTHPVTDMRIKRAQKYIEKQWYKTLECTNIY
jgi:hypothetical protein